MENKERKEIKIKLSTAIYLFIIIVLMLALFGMWCYYNLIEDNNKNESQQNIIKEETKASDEIQQTENLKAKYEEITRELKGIDCLFATNVIENSDSYTLQGVIYTQYTINYKELQEALNNGTFTINNKQYVIKYTEDGTEYDLFENESEPYALYKIKQINENEYFIESQTQISNVWKLTDKYMEITIDKDIKNSELWDENGFVTLEEKFKNFEEQEPEETTNPDSTRMFKFVFVNDKCVEINNYLTAM